MLLACPVTPRNVDPYSYAPVGPVRGDTLFHQFSLTSSSSLSSTFHVAGTASASHEEEVASFLLSHTHVSSAVAIATGSGSRTLQSSQFPSCCFAFCLLGSFGLFHRTLCVEWRRAVLCHIKAGCMQRCRDRKEHWLGGARPDASATSCMQKQHIQRRSTNWC